MARQMAMVHVVRALKHAAPSAADDTFGPSDQVLVWQENFLKNRLGKWIVPHTVDNYDADKKLVFVRLEDGEVKSFGLVQVQRYHPLEKMAISCIVDLNDRFSYFREPRYNVEVTEVILPGDPRAISLDMDTAVKKKECGLFE